MTNRDRKRARVAVWVDEAFFFLRLDSSPDRGTESQSSNKTPGDRWYEDTHEALRKHVSMEKPGNDKIDLLTMPYFLFAFYVCNYRYQTGCPVVPCVIL